MAISYVGQAVASSSPTADATITLPTGVPMVAGDLIIIAASVADTTNNALAAPSEGGYTDVIGSTIYADDVNDVNLNVFWRYYTGAQTTATFLDVGGSNASNTAVCMVFRDVATAANGGPFSATATQASGVSSSNADPAQIATATGDAVVIVGATGHTGGATATYTNPTNYTTNPAVRAHNDTIDGLVGMGYRLSGYANPEDPGVFTAATIGTATDNAWAAITMALKANNALVSCAAPTALVTTKFAPTVTRATERFTHADQANSLTAEKTWTTWSGSNLGIVSNQAKMSGINAATCRMEVDADLSALVTVEATLVTFTGGDATHYASVDIYLQKDSTSTNTRYGWVARTDAAGDQYYMYKLVSGAFTQLGSTVVMAVTNGDVMKFTWNPADNTLKGYVNGTEKLSVVDSAITTNTRTGIGMDSDDSNFVGIIDNFYLSGISQSTLVSCAAPTALLTTKYAPTVTAVNPTLVSCASPTALVTAKFAPTVTTPQRVTCASPTALVTTKFAPTITIPQRVLGASPTALLLSTFAATITIPQRVTPTTLGLTTTTYSPTVTTGGGASTDPPFTLAMMGYGR